VADDVDFTIYLDEWSYGGGLNGTFDWVWTYYDTGTGVESLPSDAVTARITPPAYQSAALSGLSAGDGDKIRIYRTGGNWFVSKLVAEFDDTDSSYVDKSPDHHLTENISLDWYQEAPPQSGILEFHNGRMFYAGDVANPGYIYVSDFEDPENVPTNFSAVDESLKYGGVLKLGGGNHITALESVGDQLYVFTDKAVYVVIGDSMADFTIRKMLDVGCKAGWSVATGDRTYFLSESFVYRVGQGSFEDISSVIIGPSIAALTEAVRRNGIGIYFDRRYYLFFTGLSLVYDERSNVWSKVEGWTVTTATVGAFGTNKEELYAGDGAGKVFTLEDGTTDDGTAISWQWRGYNSNPSLAREAMISLMRVGITNINSLTAEVVYDEGEPALTPVAPEHKGVLNIMPPSAAGITVQAGLIGEGQCTVKALELQIGENVIM